MWQVSPGTSQHLGLSLTHTRARACMRTRTHTRALLPDIVFVTCLLLCASHMIHMQCICYRSVMYFQVTIYNYVRSFQTTGSNLDSKTTYRRHICNVSILDNCCSQTLQCRSWIKIEFCELQLNGVPDGEKDLTLILFSNECDLNLVDKWTFGITGFPR
jgi:hypothetical protein